MSAIAVLNAGSSSIKFALYDLPNLDVLLHGQVKGLGTSPTIIVHDREGTVVEGRALDGPVDHHAATEAIIHSRLRWLPDKEIVAIGHRVVHGGLRFSAPVVIDDATLSFLETLVPLAPLHQPHNLAPIKAVRALRPDMPQIACFDTAFHRMQPHIMQAFALPRTYWDKGVRRYGFHGISYDYLVSRLSEVAPDLARKRVILAHLGNGASLCAVHDARSVATTMGFTALDGLMMGTRCGSIDPGVLIHLMDQEGITPRDLEDLLYRRSGLLGVSGISSDMRTLRASADPAAREALDLFVHRILREIGSLTAALGGLDAIVFSGGIGENDTATRAEVIAGCAWLGAMLDKERNAKGDLFVHAPSSKIGLLVIPTNEELMIARATKKLTAV